MRRVLIVGAGGFGREMAQWLRQHPDCGKQWALAGFLDDNAGALAGYSGYAPILGSIGDHAPAADEWLICAVALPKPKQAVTSALVARGASFMTFVHPGVVMGRDVHLGPGTILTPGVVVGDGARLGDFVTANLNTSIGQGASIGDLVTINSHCDLAARCQVDEAAFFGSHASVAAGVHVGRWSVVGAGAVVSKPVPDASRVFGNPARAFM